MTTRQRIAAAFLVLLLIAGLGLRFWPAETASGALQVVAVEDSSQRTPAIAAVLVAPQIRQLAAEKQFAWHVVDPTDQGPDLAEVQWAIDAAKGKSLPLLAIRKGTGSIKTYPLPATPAAAIALLSGK